MDVKICFDRISGKTNNIMFLKQIRFVVTNEILIPV